VDFNTEWITIPEPVLDVATQTTDGLESAADKVAVDMWNAHGGISGAIPMSQNETAGEIAWIPATDLNGILEVPEIQYLTKAEYDAIVTKDENTIYITTDEPEDSLVVATMGHPGLFDVNTFYPVGSIYLSVNNVNPGTFIGGTWVAWGTGKVPVGVDTAQTEFNTVEETGGAKTHTLGVSEIPSHTHSTMGYRNVAGQGVLVFELAASTTNPGYVTGATGGGLAHNNLPPYITCYFWKRTA
jgi:hypothetical protein